MTQAEKLLEAAQSLVGMKSENKSNAINTEFYGAAKSADWCAASVCKAFFLAGLEGLTPFYKPGDKFRYNELNAAYCPNWVRLAKELGQWVTEDYKPGDVVLFDFNGNGEADHIGIVRAFGKVSIGTFEGNVDSDQYAMKTRAVNKSVLGAFRPKYAPIGGEETPSEAEQAVDTLFEFGVINSPALWKGACKGRPSAAPTEIESLLIKFAAFARRINK